MAGTTLIGLSLIIKKIMENINMLKSDVLYNQVEKKQCMKYGLSSCVKDGVLYPGIYEKSSLKVLFVLKEPYSDWDMENNKPIDGGFYFSDIVATLKDKVQEGLNKTWLKVAAISYSLKNNTAYSENLSYEQIKEGLECVCWINLSKTPWKTTTKIDEEYISRVKAWEDVVTEQFKETDFDILIYCGIGNFSRDNPVEPDLPWNESFISDSKMYIHEITRGVNRVFIYHYKDTNKIIVNGCHPSYGNSAEWQTEFIKNYQALRE